LVRDATSSVERYLYGGPNIPGLPGVIVFEDIVNSSFFAYHKNNLHSVLGMSDDVQNNVNSYLYSAFGTQLEKIESTNQIYQFCAKEHDAQLLQYNYFYRNYYPIISKWLTKDKVNNLNLYKYCENKTNCYDQLGLDEWIGEWVNGYRWRKAGCCENICTPYGKRTNCEGVEVSATFPGRPAEGEGSIHMPPSAVHLLTAHPSPVLVGSLVVEVMHNLLVQTFFNLHMLRTKLCNIHVKVKHKKCTWERCFPYIWKKRLNWKNRSHWYQCKIPGMGGEISEQLGEGVAQYPPSADLIKNCIEALENEVCS
jgi:RHS repeat-associated protein